MESLMSVIVITKVTENALKGKTTSNCIHTALVFSTFVFVYNTRKKQTTANYGGFTSQLTAINCIN